jgi:acyl-CoA hydrolase
MSPPRAELTYRTSIRDANAAGDVHGGWILKLLDDAAVIAATRHCRTRVVTAAVDGVRFRQPVNTGDVLSFRAPNLHQLHAALHAGRTDRSLVP